MKRRVLESPKMLHHSTLLLIINFILNLIRVSVRSTYPRVSTVDIIKLRFVSKSAIPEAHLFAHSTAAFTSSGNTSSKFIFASMEHQCRFRADDAQEIPGAALMRSRQTEPGTKHTVGSRTPNPVFHLNAFFRNSRGLLPKFSAKSLEK